MTKKELLMAWANKTPVFYAETGSKDYGLRITSIYSVYNDGSTKIQLDGCAEPICTWASQLELTPPPKPERKVDLAGTGYCLHFNEGTSYITYEDMTTCSPQYFLDGQEEYAHEQDIRNCMRGMMETIIKLTKGEPID